VRKWFGTHHAYMLAVMIVLSWPASDLHGLLNIDFVGLKTASQGTSRVHRLKDFRNE
jgi:hypothetical protein